MDDTQKDILSTVQVPIRLNSNGAWQTTEVIDTVVEKTKTQYEAYKNGGLKIPKSKEDHIDVREVSKKIIDAALSFKEIVTPLTAFDPTQHASSAWAIVSLGLTMSQLAKQGTSTESLAERDR